MIVNSLYKDLAGLKNNRILVVNCGSSSVKVSLFEYSEDEFHRLFDACLKGINTEESVLEITSSKGKEIVPSSGSLTVREGLKFIFHTVTHRFPFSLASLLGIGHRFVHGGAQYSASVRVDSKVMADLEKLSQLAPLHNEACLEGIKECFSLDRTVPQIAVFDTAFHHSLPAVAANYAIPSDIGGKYPIKRYGFHGISHAFLWNTYKESIGKNFPHSKIITLHLGNGCSVAAISGGVSVDTSMGFTPAEGLIMATRAGDIDAAVMEFICLHEKKTPSEVMEILNFHSGLMGISGISSNLEALLDLYDKDEKAKLAVDMFCYRIVKYLGAYIAVLGGVEAIIFSGGIGENAPSIREQIMSKMGWYGVKLDGKANQHTVGLYPGGREKISASDSQVPVYVMASDENFFMAQEAERVLNGTKPRLIVDNFEGI